ncbi:MAG: NADP-dependent oxidoreductase, partial [Rhodospirillales bacterium]
MTTNRQIIFTSRPEGWVTLDNFAARDAAMPDVGDGDVLVRAIYMSLDPYMRGRMDAAKSYAAGFQLGEPLQARVIGQVAASKNPDYAEGALVFGALDWADYTLVPGGRG